MLESQSSGTKGGGAALITGASSGIGAVYARRLAALGRDVILVARREERLRVLAAEIEAAHGVRAEVLAADLATAAGREAAAARAAKNGGLDFLVNNAGFGTVSAFAETAPAAVESMTAVHVDAAALLCRAALPGMIARRRGAIINVSSIAGFIPLEGRVNYAATKAYLIAFSQGLRRELFGTGVRVQALCPGFTYTEFHDTEEFRDFDRAEVPRFAWMTAEQVVDASLAGLARNKVVVIPGLWNRMVVTASRSFMAPPLRGAVRWLRAKRRAGRASGAPST